MQLCPDLPVLCHVFGFAAGPGAGAGGGVSQGRVSMAVVAVAGALGVSLWRGLPPAASVGVSLTPARAACPSHRRLAHGAAPGAGSQATPHASRAAAA